MPWHVLQSHIAQERRLARGLSERGVIICAPEIKARRIQPLFPGYVLACVNLNDGDKLAMVRNARGLRSILEFAGRPATVPTDEVAAILSRVGDDGYIELGHEECGQCAPIGPAKGTRGKVIGVGLYAGLPAVFDKRLKASDRVKLLLTAAGLFHNASVIVNAGEFEPLVFAEAV